MKDSITTTPSNEKPVPDAKNLVLKRDSKIISSNFIFRRAFNALTEGTYEEFSTIYQNMLSFDWEDERLSKIKANPSNFNIINILIIMRRIPAFILLI